MSLSLRCYPGLWRDRHGAEATDLAARLVADGMAPGAVAWSYLKGAARERLLPARAGRLPARATALLAAASLAGVSVALSFAAASAGATSVARAEAAASAEAAAGHQAPAGTFRPGELLGCSSLVGQNVKAVLRALDHRGVKVVWEVPGARAHPGPQPPGSFQVTGGRALSASVVSLDVAPPNRSAARPEGPRGRHC